MYLVSGRERRATRPRHRRARVHVHARSRAHHVLTHPLSPAPDPSADAWMQFDWTLALPITLLLVYFLFILQRYVWRIYKRFRLPSDKAITGAFNFGGDVNEETTDATQQHGGGPSGQHNAQLEAQRQAELQALHAQSPLRPDAAERLYCGD